MGNQRLSLGILLVSSILVIILVGGCKSDEEYEALKAECEAMKAELSRQVEKEKEAREMDEEWAKRKVEELSAEIQEIREKEVNSLIFNGDFVYHWTFGWEAGTIDPTIGGLEVEWLPDTHWSHDKNLKMTLTQRNQAWVDQTVELPQGRTLSGLHLEAKIKLVAEEAKMRLFPGKIHCSFLVQFLNASGDVLYNLLYGKFTDRGKPTFGLPGEDRPVEPLKSCVVYMDGGVFEPIRENLEHKFLDCSTSISIDEVRKLTIGGHIMRQDSRGGKAEVYFDKVRLYYKDREN